VEGELRATIETLKKQLQDVSDQYEAAAVDKEIAGHFCDALQVRLRGGKQSHLKCKLATDRSETLAHALQQWIHTCATARRHRHLLSKISLRLRNLQVFLLLVVI
jgi:hypothetical protein